MLGAVLENGPPNVFVIGGAGSAFVEAAETADFEATCFVAVLMGFVAPGWFTWLFTRLSGRFTGGRGLFGDLDVLAFAGAVVVVVVAAALVF